MLDGFTFWQPGDADIQKAAEDEAEHGGQRNASEMGQSVDEPSIELVS